MKNYRTAFILVTAIAALLAAALVYAVWRYGPYHRAGSAAMAPSATPAASTSSMEAAASPEMGGAPQTPLAPVQLSPQRLQSIGVTSAEARVEALSDDVRALGNV